MQHVAVLIPARNEESLLPRCLRSVLLAVEKLPAGISADVLVVSDCSTDGTADVARSILQADGAVLEVHVGCVGVARALAAETALLRRGAYPATCWLANTDADCEVPANWLVSQVRHAERGVEAIAGIVDVDHFVDHLPHVEQRFRLTYCVHADGTHPHVHGANLGVRADAYLQAGGWASLETAEDHDLWRRLGETGAACLSDAKLSVVTSGRRVGRAPMGFAGALSAHNLLPDLTLLPDLADLLADGDAEAETAAA